MTQVQNNPLLLWLILPPAPFILTGVFEELGGFVPLRPLVTDAPGSPLVPASVVAAVSSADTVSMLEPTTAKFPDGTREISVPLSVTTPPGVRVRLGASEY